MTEIKSNKCNANILDYLEFFYYVCSLSNYRVSNDKGIEGYKKYFIYSVLICPEGVSRE